MRHQVKDLTFVLRRIKKEQQDLKADNEVLAEQFEELKHSKVQIQEAIAHAVAASQGGGDEKARMQQMTKSQLNQLRKQCEELKRENMKVWWAHRMYSLAVVTGCKILPVTERGTVAAEAGAAATGAARVWRLRVTLGLSSRGMYVNNSCHLTFASSSQRSTLRRHSSQVQSHPCRNV